MVIRKEIARYHTVVHTRIRRAGREDMRIYVLYLMTTLHAAPAPLLPLVEYILDHGRTRSLAWQRELTRSVGLLFDFLHANATHFKSIEGRPQVLAAFADALVGGTININGSDASGLFWEQKSLTRATVTLNSVTSFSDWLVNRYATTALNPWKTASVAEQIAYWRRFDQRRATALLRHTMDRASFEESSRKARSVKILRKSVAVEQGAPPKTFPDAQMANLISQGFAPRKKSACPYAQ